MNVPRRFKVVLALVVGVSMAAFGVAERNLGLAGLILSAAWGGWLYTEWTGKGRGLPRWATNFMLMGVMIGALVRAGQGGAMVSAFNGFLASLIAVKMWERREVRDYAQVLTLSLFLAVGATLNHNSLGVGLPLIVLVPLLAYAAMAFQVIAGEARHGRRGLSAPLPDFKLGMLSMNAALVAVVMSVVVFLMIPRGVTPPAGMSSFGQLLAGRVTGMSDRVQLGQGGLISESQAVALHVRMSDASGATMGGEGQIQYFRGTVLDDYRGGTWTRSEFGTLSEVVQRSSEPLRAELVPWTEALPSARIVQDFELRGVGANEAQLFAVYRPTELMENPGAERGVDTERMSTRYKFDRVSGWFSRSGPAGPLSYSVVSAPGARERGGVSRRGAVAFPSERLTALARDLLKEAQLEPDPRVRPVEDDVLAARAIEAYLRRSCTYTLDIRAAPRGVDPTEWFVFTEKRGHCEYFASALAGMCRAVGIDARVVTGYVASQFDYDLRSYIVRASNAHAWTEVNVGPGVWRTLDATPPEDFERQHGAPQGLLMRLSRLLGDMEDVWSSRVVSFDQSAQDRMFGGRARALIAEDWGTRLRQWVQELRRPGSEGASEGSGAWGLLVGAGALAVGVVLLVRRMKRPREDVQVAPGVRRLRAEILSACAHAGLPRPASAALRRHVERVAASRPELAPDLLAATDLVYAVCFGGGEADVKRAAALSAALRRYRR